MITGNIGGAIQRSMPPVDWDCGPIPEQCYDPSLSKLEIMNLLTPVYLAEERVKRLADSQNKLEILRAKIALDILVEIDAETIWCWNRSREQL